MDALNLKAWRFSRIGSKNHSDSPSYRVGEASRAHPNGLARLPNIYSSVMYQANKGIRKDGLLDISLGFGLSGYRSVSSVVAGMKKQLQKNRQLKKRYEEIGKSAASREPIETESSHAAIFRVLRWSPIPLHFPWRSRSLAICLGLCLRFAPSPMSRSLLGGG